MSKRDYYEILGLTKGASADEIKRSYRKLAKEFHPDHNPGDPKALEKFKEIQEAYSTLSDPKKRTEYDQFGRAGVGSFQTGPGGSKVYSWGGGGSRINVEDLEELLGAFGRGGARHASIFDQFFGGTSRGGGFAQEAPYEEPVQEQEISLTFEQAIKGTTLILQQADGNGRSGQRIEVKIPPGVREGQRIRIRGQQTRGRTSGPPHDIYLTCRIQPHAYFRREGDDVYLDVPIGLTEAALGGEVEVPTLDGRATIKIPPGTRSGTRLRLKGRGVAAGAAKGDFYAVIQIVAPRNLSAEQIEDFRRLGKDLNERPRDGVPWAI